MAEEMNEGERMEEELELTKENPAGSTLMDDRLYVELTNDLLFHMVFSKNMEALKDLLSSLLAMDPDRIQRIEILNPMQYNDSYETKETILDLKIHLNNESFILVEIQVREFKYWTNRTLIYACRQITDQTNGKDAYQKLQPVVQIAIMKYSLFPERRRFYTEYKLQDDEQQELTDKLKFYVLDLTAVDLATETDQTNGLVEWAKAFNAKNWDAVNQIERKGIREAANTMEVIMATPSQRQKIWERKLALMDYNTEIYSAREEGKAEGRAEGKAEGRDEEKIRIARSMKQDGDSDEKIARITGMSLKEIAAL